jgi:hypothetical protein
MALDANPFIVLSYVGGPALLTNATSVFILSTSNRFARAVDRSRVLVEKRLRKEQGALENAHIEELREVQRRVRLLVNALSGFYLAVGTFALATLGSIAGAVLAEFYAGPLVMAVIVGAVGSGVIGFCGFIAGAVLMVRESRMAQRSLRREANEALRQMDRARA